MVNSNTSKPPWVTRGSNQIVFFHDSEHARIKQAGATGTTLYLNGAGVMSERLNGSGGTTQWTDYLFAGGEMIGMRVEHSASGRERGGSASEVRSYERQVLCRLSDAVGTALLLCWISHGVGKAPKYGIA